jgi:hypothetical protein
VPTIELLAEVESLRAKCATLEAENARLKSDNIKLSVESIGIAANLSALRELVREAEEYVRVGLEEENSLGWKKDASEWLQRAEALVGGETPERKVEGNERML